MNDEDVMEDFFRRLCMMFIPWKNEESFLADRGETLYTEAFLHFQAQLLAASSEAYSDLEKIVSNFMDLKRQDRIIGKQLEEMRVG